MTSGARYAEFQRRKLRDELSDRREALGGLDLRSSIEKERRASILDLVLR